MQAFKALHNCPDLCVIPNLHSEFTTLKLHKGNLIFQVAGKARNEILKEKISGADLSDPNLFCQQNNLSCQSLYGLHQLYR